MKRSGPLKRKTPLKAKPQRRSVAAREVMAGPVPCAICESEQATHAHHRRLRSQGGADTKANLLPLCHACHGFVHENPAYSMALGYIVGQSNPEWDELGKDRYGHS